MSFNTAIPVVCLPLGVLEDLQRRLNKLDTWKVAVHAARTPQERQRTPPTSPSCAPPAATPPRKSSASTVSPRVRKTRFRRRQVSASSAGSEAQAPSAAQSLVDSRDLLALVLQPRPAAIVARQASVPCCSQGCSPHRVRPVLAASRILHQPGCPEAGFCRKKHRLPAADASLSRAI